MARAPEPLLRAEGVTVRFGGVRALSDVAVSVPHRALVGLVGPNGSGKSTLFAVLSGLLRPNAGRVELLGADVTNRSPQARARMGLARTFQHPELFRDLTVREHLVLAYRMRFDRRRLWTDLVDGRSWRRAPSAEGDRVGALLEMLGITDIAGARVAGLPLGTSRLVEVGRALAASPALVLLDEPTSGLDASESERLADVLTRVTGGEGVSFVLVEHDVDMVLSLCESVSVLDLGRVIASGTPDTIRQDAAVRTAYLGDDPGMVEGAAR